MQPDVEMATEHRGARQLGRLTRLVDVVFALVIWRIFTILPQPDPENLQWGTIVEMLTDQWPRFAIAVIAVLIVVIYWLQSNAMLNKLSGTDAMHSGIVVFQLLFLLFYLYTIDIGIRVGSATDTRAFESVGAVLVGVAGYVGWRYVLRRREFLVPGMTSAEARVIAKRSIAEPLTALLTIPFAFVGPWAWELSWFLYPAIRFLLGRSHTR